jgi:hypothetical protein
MRQRKMFLGLVGLCVLGAVLLGLVISAQGQEEKKGRPTTGRGMNAEEREKRTADRMKERLGVTDAEWKAFGPKVMKVSTLSRQLISDGGFGRIRRDRPDTEGDGGGKRRPDRGDRVRGSERDREQTPLRKSAADLEKVLENKQAKPEEIAKGLAAYRKLRADANAELAAAKKELGKVVSGRQEAQLVLAGLLD